MLRARAVEAETALAFAGLSELLRPLTPLLGELEPAQASALAAALGVRAPLADAAADGEEGRGAAPFAVAVALLGLLEAAAVRAPSGVAVLVDDAHWLDDASLDALCFAARRLLHEGVAVLRRRPPEPDRGLAARGSRPASARPARRRRRPRAGAGSGEEGAASVGAGDAAGGRRGRRRWAVLPGETAPLADAALERVLAAAAGNPLALVELTRALSDAERAGAAAAQGPIRPSAAIERAYRAELAALPPATVRALLLPAADEKLPLARIRAALAAAGLDPAALEPAERAGLLHAEQGRLRFRHPLLRAVVYHAAPFAERAAAHRALAAVLEADGEEPDRRAWHLAAACDGPDDEVAGLLVAVAEQARARGALDAVAHTLARAAELTPAAPPTPARQPFCRASAPPASARRASGREAYAAVGQPARALELAEAALADSDAAAAAAAGGAAPARRRHDALGPARRGRADPHRAGARRPRRPSRRGRRGCCSTRTSATASSATTRRCSSAAERHRGARRPPPATTRSSRSASCTPPSREANRGDAGAGRRDDRPPRAAAARPRQRALGRRAARRPGARLDLAGAVRPRRADPRRR